MKKQTYRLICFTFLLLPILTVYPQAENTFDFLNGRIFGMIIDQITIDSITDTLGRPTKVIDATENVGVQLCYPDKGLWILFKTPEKDPEQHCHQVRVYLIEKYKKDDDLTYKPFEGKIIPNVSSDTKTKHIIEGFSEYNARPLSDDPKVAESMKTFKNAKGLFREVYETLCSIRLKKDNFSIDFQYDDITKYIKLIDFFIADSEE